MCKSVSHMAFYAMIALRKQIAPNFMIPVEVIAPRS